jgi:thioester reductase-like protein
VLTGATGALGMELLPRLLRRYPDMDLVALVRGRSAQEAEARLAKALDDPQLLAAEGHRIQVLAGDLARPLLGLDEATAAALAARTQKLFHLAANVRFSASLPESRAGNVDTTRVVLDFSRRCLAANPGRFELHYASTAYVVGDRVGPLREDELACGQGFWNAYEQSKLEAEQLATAARAEMPVTVYRPSQVICVAADGRVRKLFGFLEFMKLACSGRAMINLLPARPEVRSDMVPIDFVCDAMAYLSGEPDARNRTFLLAAGVARSLPLREVIDIAYQVIRRLAPDLGSFPRPTLLPPEVFEEQVRSGRIHPALGGLLGIYQTYLTYDRDFQVEDTLGRLARGGIHLPPMEEVIGRSIGHVVERYLDPAAVRRALGLDPAPGLPNAAAGG